MQARPDRSAFDNFFDEFGLDIDEFPESHLIYEGFDNLCNGNNFSLEAETAILYRVIAMQYAALIKISSESSEIHPSSEDLSFITDLRNASVGWSKRSHDHIHLEGITSNLNRALVSTINKLHAYEKDDADKDVYVGERSPTELKSEVLRCARISINAKSKFRLSQLTGFFDNLKRKPKITVWAENTSKEYERIVNSLTELWDASSVSSGHSLAKLWGLFGLGNASSDEAIYDDKVAIEVLSAWLVSLYPDARISSSELTDEVLRLGLKNTRALEAAHSSGGSISMPLPIDQVVARLDRSLGPYV